MTKVQYRLAALSALATAALALAACNSEPNVRASGPSTDAAPAATISKITLEAYSKDRSAAVATTAAAPQDLLRAALTLAVPPLQSSVFTSNGPITLAEQAIVFPALQAARMDVLRAASAGDTLAEVQAAVPTAASLEATRSLLGGLSRQIWASASATFARSFLASTEISGAPASGWQANTVLDWSSPLAALAEFGPTSDLSLVPQTRMVIGQRFDLQSVSNAQALGFEGLGESAQDGWYIAMMVAFEGPGGSVNVDGYSATATWVGEHLWVSLRPPGNKPLLEGLAPSTLSAALLAVWSAYPSPQGLVTRSRQVWPQLTASLVDRGKLPVGIVLPYNPVSANLGGLDGGGTYLTETARAAALSIDTGGLRASGAQTMAFTFSAENMFSNSYGYGVITLQPNVQITPSVFLTPCPRAVPDWRGAYLALIDRAGRLLLLATLPKPTGAVALTRCLSDPG